MTQYCSTFKVRILYVIFFLVGFRSEISLFIYNAFHYDSSPVKGLSLKNNGPDAIEIIFLEFLALVSLYLQC